MATRGVSVSNILDLTQLRRSFNVMSQRHRERFETTIYAQGRPILLAHAKKNASRISRSGDLERGITVKRGGLGTGRAALGLRVTGPASAYANIVNKGGIIRPKNVQHLTEPLSFAQDSFGRKRKPLTQYPSKDTFTWDKPGRKFGQLADKKVVFYRPKGFKGIIPLFVLTKEKKIEATFWADNAVRDTLAELQPILRERAERLLAKASRGGIK